METITSRRNPLAARFRRAARRDAGADATVLLEGPRLVEDALAAGLRLEVAAVSTSPAPRVSALARRLDPVARVVRVPSAVMEALSPAATPSGLVALAALRPALVEDVMRASPPLVVGLSGVQDPGNTGAVIRAVEAGGASGVVTVGGADPLGWKALRGAMGSAFRVPVARAEDPAAVRRLASAHGLRVVAAAPRGGDPADRGRPERPLPGLARSRGRGPRPRRGRDRRRDGDDTDAPARRVAQHRGGSGDHRLRGRPTAERRGRARCAVGGARTRIGMTSGTLFDEPPDEPGTAADTPLAERMRPRRFDELVGQDELVGRGRPLRQAIERDTLRSIILWGPPGSGKTTLARLIADVTTSRFVAFSAVLSGIKEIRGVLTGAEAARARGRRRTILFVDEIHRFNKAQQDAFLPRVEAGDIVLVGATTENPSFEVNAALLSRSQVYVLKPLPREAVATLLTRALADTERGLGGDGLRADPDALAAIARHANGDARVALNLLELGSAAALAARPRAGRPTKPGSLSSSRPTPCSGARCSTTRAARSTST